MNDDSVMASAIPAELLRQAAEWRLLGLLFEPPHGPWREELKALVAEVDDEQLAAAARQAGEEADAGVYHSTLGPGGPACPREVSHHVTLTPGGLLSEIESCYAAFGYTPACREAPDHIAVEAGFLTFLSLKQAYAAASGRLEQAEIAGEAIRFFLSEHLARIADPLARALNESGIGYLATAAAALRARTGPARQIELPLAQPWEEADEPTECL